MEDEQSATNQNEDTSAAEKPAEKPSETASATTSAPAETAAPAKREGRPDRGDRPRGENRGPREGGAREGGSREGGNREGRGPGGPPRGPGGPGGRGGDDKRGERHGDRREGRPMGGRPFGASPEIELDKLLSDSLYLDNQAHAVVMQLRDLDSGTKSQLRRLYGAVRRAVRTVDSERQHEFVMLRARLAYTIARHSLRSLDGLERLLLQVTRRNDARGYERFKDLFEAIVAYNE